MPENKLNYAEDFFLYRMNHDKIFELLERGDYITLYEIKRLCEQNGGQVYLTDFAEKCEIPVHEASKMMGKLQDKGYIIWRTDENKERTFIKLTEKAMNSLKEEKSQMENLYQKMQDSIAPQNLKITFETMKQIHDIIYEENK